MSVEQMRECLKKKYNYADKWVRKVDGMADNQVIAIYFRMLHSNELV